MPFASVFTAFPHSKCLSQRCRPCFVTSGILGICSVVLSSGGENIVFYVFRGSGQGVGGGGGGGVVPPLNFVRDGKTGEKTKLKD